MIRRMAKYGGIFVIVIGVILFLAWATSPNPEFNAASFEGGPLQEEIAPLDMATTLAQFSGPNGKVVTIQVLEFSEEAVTGVDLMELGAAQDSNPFAALASAQTALDSTNRDNFPTLKVAWADLLPAAPPGARHIGTGTNFPEHAEETGSTSVFSFPKFGKATPARTNVRSKDEILLDYEVEFCIRFDRDIASLADFDAAEKGIFLCGDFTDRNAIIDLVDPDNLDSGSGFSDAKSGPDFFPSGPFLVVPKDWSSFVDNLRMTTSINDEPRQDAKGAEMHLDFRQLAEKSLGDMTEQRFLYQDGYNFLAPDKRIDASMALMSGTAEGVIFTPPARGDIIEGFLSYLGNGGPLSGNDSYHYVKKTFIENELASGHYLQPGDTVRYRSSFLGNIEIKVIE